MIPAEVAPVTSVSVRAPIDREAAGLEPAWARVDAGILSLRRIVTVAGGWPAALRAALNVSPWTFMPIAVNASCSSIVEWPRRAAAWSRFAGRTIAAFLPHLPPARIRIRHRIDLGAPLLDL